MIDSGSENFLTKSKIKRLREIWAGPDENQAVSWETDGVFEHGDRKSYNHEMIEALSGFGCKSFDELVLWIQKKIGRKPNVTDFMGGAYFLHSPENTNSLTGIRIKNKDMDFLKDSKEENNEISQILRKIIKSPNRKVIEADILTNKGWNLIKSQDLPLADLLVCRPVGPFDLHVGMGKRLDSGKAYVGLYASLFNRMLSLVNRDGGIIFTEIPDMFTNEEIQKFFTETDNREGSFSWLFTVKDEIYHSGGATQRYAVVQFKRAREK